MPIPHPDLMRWHEESADFRCLLVSDPLLMACWNTGRTPLETVVALADRAADMQRKMADVYEKYVPIRCVIRPIQPPTKPE